MRIFCSLLNWCFCYFTLNIYTHIERSWFAMYKQIFSMAYSLLICGKHNNSFKFRYNLLKACYFNIRQHKVTLHMQKYIQNQNIFFYNDVHKAKKKHDIEDYRVRDIVYSDMSGR